MLKAKIIEGRKMRITNRGAGGFKFTIIPEGGTKGNRMDIIASPSAKASAAYNKMVNEAGSHVAIKYEITAINKKGLVYTHRARIL